MARRKTPSPPRSPPHPAPGTPARRPRQVKPKLRPGSEPAQPTRAGRGDRGRWANPALLYGWHAVAAALGNPRRRIRTLWCTADQETPIRELLGDRPDAASSPAPQPQVTDRAAIAAMLPEGAVHQGVAARADPLPEPALEEVLEDHREDPTAVFVVLDQVTDPQNVGAILRSVAAFGAVGLIMQDRHAPPLTGALAKAASGAVDVVPVVRVVNVARAITRLRAGGYWCVGLAEQTETELAEVDLSGRAALVLGAEGTGLRRLTRETCDQLVRLPTRPPIGSLNVSVAASVALYQAELARRAGLA